ncbi:MAG: hypothetical protein ACM3L6_06310 [Deltaproteobacteria bacterium]
MKRRLFLIVFLVWGMAGAARAQEQVSPARGPVLVRVFYQPHCGACHIVLERVLPPLVSKYGGRVAWKYIDITEEENYKRFLDLEKQSGRSLGTPTVLVGSRVLVGVTEVADNLDGLLAQAVLSAPETILLTGAGVDLLEHFRSFGVWAVLAAGLADGFNPCAFTVIVFFVSFLAVMGYRRREQFLIGLVYIFAVFLTYVAIGLGFFRFLYSLKGFMAVSATIYGLIGAFSWVLACFALKDYVVYKRTGRTDEMSLQLPRPIKNRIHAIIGDYYRRDKETQRRALGGLLVSAFVVGFMISILEAVCTGQFYLPTIVFVLKEPSLRARALRYLLGYNLMFIAPLFFILVLAALGATSRDFEAAARRHLGTTKLVMALIFFVLGFVLLKGLVF